MEKICQSFEKELIEVKESFKMMGTLSWYLKERLGMVSVEVGTISESGFYERVLKDRVIEPGTLQESININHDGKVLGKVFITHNDDNQKEIKKKLQSLVEVFSKKFYEAIQHERAMVRLKLYQKALLSFETDEHNNIIWVSESLHETLGYFSDAMLDKKPSHFFEFKDDKPGICSALSADGRQAWFNVTKLEAKDPLGENGCQLYILSNIDEQIKAEEISNRDDLTNLYNRRYFNEVFTVEAQAAEASNENVVLMVMDIDNFKGYNDNYGHPEGDKALKKVAKTISSVFKRTVDHVFRLGGEEFAVLVRVNDKSDALNLAERARVKIKEAGIIHEYNDGFGVVTVSIGVSVASYKDGFIHKQMYHQADAALYEAKQLGRNRVCLK